MIVEVESSEMSNDADAIVVSNEALMPTVFGDARPLSNTAILRGVVMVLIVSEVAVVKRTEYKPYFFETVSTFRYAHFNLFEPFKGGMDAITICREEWEAGRPKVGFHSGRLAAFQLSTRMVPLTPLSRPYRFLGQVSDLHIHVLCVVMTGIRIKGNALVTYSSDLLLRQSRSTDGTAQLIKQAFEAERSLARSGYQIPRQRQASYQLE